MSYIHTRLIAKPSIQDPGIVFHEGVYRLESHVEVSFVDPIMSGDGSLLGGFAIFPRFSARGEQGVYQYVPPPSEEMPDIIRKIIL